MVCSRSALREVFEGRAEPDLLDFAEASGESRSRMPRLPDSSRVRPSWVSEARLKVISRPSGLVKVSG